MLGGPAGRLRQPISLVAAHGVPAALLLGLQGPSGRLRAPPAPLPGSPDSSRGWRRGAEDSAVCATSRERESRSGRSGREGRAARTAPGREWKKSGSCRSSRTGELPSGSAPGPQADAAGLSEAALRPRCGEAAIQTCRQVSYPERCTEKSPPGGWELRGR